MAIDWGFDTRCGRGCRPDHCVCFHLTAAAAAVLWLTHGTPYCPFCRRLFVMTEYHFPSPVDPYLSAYEIRHGLAGWRV